MKPLIGDVIEIRTSNGLAYALFTHDYKKPPHYGALVRVFSGVFESRPRNLNDLLGNPIQFSTFFPLHEACKRGLVAIVGHLVIPENLAGFPLFRANGFRNPITGEIGRFFIWDGEKSLPVESLTDEQKKYPVKSIMNDTRLIEKIQAGWKPEDDFK